MLPSTPEGRRNLFLQYGPDYSFGRPNTPSSQHADHSGSSSSMEQYTHERERYPSPDSHPLAQRIHAPSRSQQAPENLSSMTSSNRSTSSHQHSNVHEHDQGMAGQSSTRLAMHQRRQFQNGPGASPRQIRRTKSVENLRVAHTNAQQPLVRATAPLPAATQPSVPAMHKSKSGPLRETMRRVFSRGDHASTSNSPQSSRLALIRPRGLYSSSRTSRSSPRLSVLPEAAEAYPWTAGQKMRSNATTPSSKKRSTDADTSPSREIQVRNAMESTEPPEATPLWATSTESTPRPDISTRSAHDLHDWFQAVRASKEFGPPVGGSASSARRSSPTPPANEPAVASAPRSSGSAGSNTSFQSSTSSEHALPPPVRDPRRRSHDDLASSAHHQYHTSSLLAEAGSPGIAPPSSPILRHQVSLPRAAMEIASLLARVSQLEDQMLQVEETQAKSRRQLNRIEGHLDALVREGRKRHDMQRSRGRRPASRQENRRIPTPDTWLQGNSSASSIDEGSSPRTPPVAVADFASGYVLAGTTKAKLLRESLLHEGYGTSLLKVFAVVNDEHEARLTLQEDVAHIRSAIEGMKQHLPHDMVDRTSPDRHPPLQNPTNRGPSVTPYTNMGSHFSYDSSDDEVEESEGSTRASNPGTPLDQPNLGLGLTTRNSTEQGGNESFSTPPLRPSSRM